ncbi:MAG: DUF1232 domain-containing protein [Motilibacteraceae bacterium]
MTAPRTVRRAAALRSLWRAVREARRGGPGLGEHLAAVPRMIRAAATGQYRELAAGRLALALLAVLYVLSPVDVVPEALLGIIGLGDDLLVTTWLAGTLLGETGRFLAWERERGRVVRGAVVTG